MGRLKNFPRKLSVGMRGDGSMILLPEKVDWELVGNENIKKTMTYYSKNQVSGKEVLKEVRRRRRKPKPASTIKTNPETVSPTPIENTKEPTFRCTACGRDVDNPKTAEGGKTQCPHCLKIGTIVGKE